ncbi:MAG: 16S rRNA (cytidine(1402)-2'-O)-methyltransferase [Pseudomonadota bacterium]
MDDTSDAMLSGGLYVVATPIGAARDITLRALDVLGAADVLACEDTRTTRRLMDIHGIARAKRPMLAYHDHNAAALRDTLMGHLAAGRSVVLVSEAGTPTISDPGFDIVRAAGEAGHPVVAVPGASAAVAALAVAGLPTDRFLFAGFPPAKTAARRRWITGLSDAGATLVLYESPRRVLATLEDLAQAFGPDHRATLCREMTKRHEETLRGTLTTITATLATRETIKGEIVLVLDSPPAKDTAIDPEELLRAALRTLSLKDAAKAVSAQTGMPRKTLYDLALKLREGSS